MGPILLYDLEDVPHEQLLAVLLSWRITSPAAPIYVFTRRKELPQMGSPALDGGCFSVDPEEYSALTSQLSPVYVPLSEGSAYGMRAALTRWLVTAQFAEQRCHSPFVCATTSVLAFISPELVTALLSPELGLV